MWRTIIASALLVASCMLTLPADGDAQVANTVDKAKKKKKPATKPEKDAEDKVRALLAERKKLEKRLTEIDEQLSELDFPAWTTDLKKVTIPDVPVMGRIGGKPFHLHSTRFTAITLHLDDVDMKITIFHRLKAGQSIAGRTIESSGETGMRDPTVHVWGPKGGAAFSGRITFRLEFGEEKDNIVPGKIYLSVADGHRSVIAGNFTVQLR